MQQQQEQEDYCKNMDTTRRKNKCCGHEFSFSDVLCNRQIGFPRPRTFARRFSASEGLVKRIDAYGKLNGHEGCVNALQFNSTGEHLVSGSDDRKVMIWNWDAAKTAKTLKLSYPSGHMDNIFQTRIMPFTDDRRIVTSAADGQVRLGEILDNGNVETKRVGRHQGRVHKLAVEPGSSNIFYSCGEDGLVQRFDLRSNSATKLFSCSSFAEDNNDRSRSPRTLRLNAIVIDPRNPNYFAIGGSDPYARIYDLRNSQNTSVNTFCPHHLIKTRNARITGLAYSNTSELLVSYSDELVYLFHKNMGLGLSPPSLTAEDLKIIEEPVVYSGHRNSRTIKGVSFFGPNDEYVSSGSDCGHIFIWKKKGAALVRVMVGDRHIVNHLEPHPYLPLLATCGIEKNIKIWAPMSHNVRALPHDIEEIMESNRQGREEHSRVTLTPDVIMHVLRLHRRQAMAYMERRYTRGNIDSDDDDEVGGGGGGGGTILLGFSSDGDGDSDEGDTGNSRDCNIS